MSSPDGRRLQEPGEATFQRQLAAARSGCADAMGQILDGCRRYLLLSANRSLASSLRPKEGASDLVQKTFIVAQHEFKSFCGESLGELLSWLERILESQIARQARHYRYTAKRAIKHETSLEAEPFANERLLDRGVGPVEAAMAADDRQRIQRALERLSADDQAVLTLRAWQRLPFAEIGRRLGRSTGAAEKLWIRAIERLDRELRALE